MTFQTHSKMLLLIDNFDSFTFNLVQYFQVLGLEVRLLRNNALPVKDLLELKPSYLVISPGPGHPGQAGISKELIAELSHQIPILGVCLGHQCIGELYGGNVIRARQPIHGKTSRIFHDGKGIFREMPQGFSATRYHSLIVERKTLPSCLEISAETDEGEIMGLRHRDFQSMEGVQFHPESILTESGIKILSNFINKS
jgi:anthranilate synthase/aminodeoxychorismate synthase-like glutamine amidotransferase